MNKALNLQELDNVTGGVLPVKMESRFLKSEMENRISEKRISIEEIDRDENFRRILEAIRNGGNKMGIEIPLFEGRRAIDQTIPGILPKELRH
ncbi:MAG: hypothetical protein K5865_04110 [Eubacterium sp.]|nr:hypothetical protein [Eubacterium sp.]